MPTGQPSRPTTNGLRRVGKPATSGASRVWAVTALALVLLAACSEKPDASGPLLITFQGASYDVSCTEVHPARIGDPIDVQNESERFGQDHVVGGRTIVALT